VVQLEEIASNVIAEVKNQLRRVNTKLTMGDIKRTCVVAATFGCKFIFCMSAVRVF
jgi:hypothetical protein